MPDHPTPTDKQMMRRCIDLALRARAKGNTAVGSLVVIDGQVIAEAEEDTPAGPDRFGHAEILAVLRAGEGLGQKTLPKATLYTTAEPCLLCAYAIREAQIGRVVIGSPTPHIGAVTSLYPILVASDIGPWGDPPVVLRDVLLDACDALRSNRPHAEPTTHLD